MSVGKTILAILLSVALGVALLLACVGRQLDRTWLRGDFVADRLDDMDFIGLATGIMIANLTGEAKDLWPPMEKSINENRPWIKEELRRSLKVGFAYFRSDSDQLRLEIPLRAVRENFAGHLKIYLRGNPPPDVASLPSAEREKTLADIEAAFVASLGMPDVFVFDVATTAPDNRADLEEVRQMFTAIRWITWAALAISAATAAMLVWMASVRWLGVVMALFGLLVYVPAKLLTGAFVARVLDRLLELPNTVVEHLPPLYENSLGPLTDAALVLIAGGAVLVILSCVLPRKNPAASNGA